MKDKHNLNLIYETVYERSVPKQESFLHKYNKHDDVIRECAVESGSIASEVPEKVIDTIDPSGEKK